MHALFATTPTPQPDPQAALTSAQIVLLGLALTLLVLFCAMGLLMVIRLRRSGTTPKKPGATRKDSPWAIAGGRAEVDEDDGMGGVLIGDDDDGDPNEDTWAGAPPG